ncbi:MAG: AsmA family protein, partial [Bacteroidota bacterium]
MKYIKRCMLAVLILVISLISTLFIITTFYKKEIADVLIQNLKTNFGLTLKVNDVDVSLFRNFPHVSINFKEVSLNNDISPAAEPLLKAAEVTISFDLKKLLNKEFEINSVLLEDANINLVTNKDGSKNFQLKNNDTLNTTKKQNNLDFNIHKVDIKNTVLNFTNLERGQHIGINFIENAIELKKQAEGFDFSLKGNTKVEELLFNTQKGAFLKGTVTDLNLKGVVFTKSRFCFVYDPSYIEIDHIKYAVNAFIQPGEEKKLVLKIAADQVPYDKGIKLVNKKIAKTLSEFKLYKPINLNLLLAVNLGVKQEPIVLVNIHTKDNSFSIGSNNAVYEHISFKGMVLSLDSSFAKGNEEKAVIQFTSVKGDIYNVPFEASVKVNSFTDPHIAIAASFFIDAAKVKLKASNEFDLKGKCVANIRYSGSTHKLNKEEFLNNDMKLKAVLAFKDFSYKEKNKPYVYTINGNAKLDNRDLTFNRLILKTAGGNVTLNGKADSFTAYALGLQNHLKISLNAYADQFNLNPFIKTSSTNASSKGGAAASSKAVKQKTEESSFDFNVSLKAKKMFIRKVIAEEVYMNIAYKNSLLNVRSLSMNTCDGKLNANATIDHLQKIQAQMNLENINVTKLFDQFEDFGQQVIKSKQLKGKISVSANFDTELDNDMKIIPASLAGNVRLKLKEGHLLEYEPLQNVSNFIFHNRDFHDITFSEINESFKINGYEMKIEELEIASNILNLFVSGTYNFKSQSNINLIIPWNNLKRRGKNYIPK